MSAIPHAEKFIEVNQILAKDGAITTLDRTAISVWLATLIHEISEKDDALGHFSCENQRLSDALDHALKKHNEQRGMANDLRHELTDAQNELAPIKASLSHQRERVSYLEKEVERLKSANEKIHQDHDTVAICQRRQHASIEAETKEQLPARQAELREVGKKNEHLQCVAAALTSSLEESQKSFTDIQSENARLHKKNHDLLHENAEKEDALGHFSCETQRLTDELASLKEKYQAECRAASYFQEKCENAGILECHRSDIPPPEDLCLESMCDDAESEINSDPVYPYVCDCSPPTRGRIESFITSKWTGTHGYLLISEEDLEEKIKVALEETPHAPSNLSPTKRMEIARAWKKPITQKTI